MGLTLTVFQRQIVLQVFRVFSKLTIFLCEVIRIFIKKKREV